MSKSTNASTKRPILIDEEEEEETPMEEEVERKVQESAPPGRSAVWKHMKKLKTEDKETLKAQCTFCNQVFSGASRNGTSHLKRHLDKCMARHSPDIRNFMLGSSNASDGTNTMALKNPRINLEEVRKSICYFVVSGSHPFSIVEEPGFKYMASIMCPTYDPKSRHTCRRDALKHYADHKKAVELELANAPGRICFTSDNWRNDHTQDEYICITTHWIDANWKLQKRIIRFGALTPPFDGLHIADDVSNCLGKWKIDSKVACFTLDNASYNDRMVAEVKRKLLRSNIQLLFSGQFFQIRCACHIINLVVQAGLGLLDQVIFKIRGFVKLLKHSIPKKETSYKCAGQTYHLNVKKRLRGDCSVRWNSTYFMLSRALYFREAIDEMVRRDGDMSKFEIEPSEWDKVSTMHDFLKVFYDVTNDFSASKTPTANLYFKGVWEIHSTLLEYSQGPYDFMRGMIREMKEKFDKYWSDYHLLLSCACVLDPRYKLAFVEYCYATLGGDLYGKEMAGEIKRTLYELLKEYVHADGVDAQVGESSSGRSGGVGDCVGGASHRLRKLQRFTSWMSQRSTIEVEKSQLDMYLEEKVIGCDVDLDILAYWRDNASRFPQLAALARDVLAIPVSTVPSESAFSVGKRLINPWRASLTSKTIESLACLEDWLRAKGLGFGSSIFSNPLEEAKEEEEEDEEDNNIEDLT